MYESSCCSISSLPFGGVSVFNFSHSNSCVMVSRCFNLQFTNDIGWRASFHMLLSHLYIFFGEASVKIFSLFLNQVVCFLIVEFLVYSLYILDSSPLSDMHFANICYQSVACSTLHFYSPGNANILILQYSFYVSLFLSFFCLILSTESWYFHLNYSSVFKL